jgi:hypothetical protein
MNQDLADLLAAVFLEEPACGMDMMGIVDEIELLGLHEVPRYAPLVAAMKAAIDTPAVNEAK